MISKLTSCAARLCRACVDPPVCVAVRYLTLRIGRERHGRKDLLPFSFSERSSVSGLRARLGNKGKVGAQRGRETAGVPSFLPQPWARRTSRAPQSATPLAESQRKTLRPDRVNRLRGSGAPVNRCKMTFSLQPDKTFARRKQKSCALSV